MRLRKLLVWLAAAVLVVLLGRALGYATVDGPAARAYRGELGGPGLPAIALASLGVGAAIAVAVCWLAALGVRERRLLERRVLDSPLPPLRPGRIVVNAVALWALAAPAAGLLEAYLHWRSGLGWHGLNCLLGPVHRDLLPIVGALCLLAAAAIAAGDHVLAWMRRAFALVRAAAVRFTGGLPEIAFPLESRVARERFRPARGGARAPPALA